MGMSTTTPARVDDLVAATPASRDRTVDFLRALSIGVVVLWHWVFSVTHWDGGRLTMPNPIGEVRGRWLATWLLQVMPLFFIVGGFSNLAAWEAVRRDGGGAAAFLRRRLARLFRPVAVFVAVWAVVDTVLRLFVPSYAGVLDYGMVVFVPLWFLGVYTGAVLLVPLTAALHRRARELAVVGLAAAIVLGDLGRFRFGVSELGWATAAVVFLFAHQLGYFWRDGGAGGAGIPRRTAWSLVVGGLTTLVVLTNLGVYPRSMVAVRGEAVSNMNPTTACIAALAVLQLGVVLLVQPALARWLERRRVWKAVVTMNAVAMTVFVWHMTALLAAIAAFQAAGGRLSAEPTVAWWAQRPLWFLLPGLALAGLVAVFARVELPRDRRRAGQGRRWTETA